MEKSVNFEKFHIFIFYFQECPVMNLLVMLTCVVSSHLYSRFAAWNMLGDRGSLQSGVRIGRGQSKVSERAGISDYIYCFLLEIINHPCHNFYGI